VNGPNAVSLESNLVLAEPMAVVTLDTTGPDPRHDRIWSLAIMPIDQGQPGECLFWQFDPGMPIPATVGQRRVTPVLPLHGLPVFSEQATEIIKAFEGRRIVAHNARLSYIFLRRGLRESGLTLHSKVLCTLKMARFCWPSLPSHRLDSLHDVLAPDSRPDVGINEVRTVWQLLQRLADHLTVEDWQAALDQQRRIITPRLLSSQELDALPQRPGVYRFYAETGALLYVGKSVNIRSRVLSHCQADGDSRRQMQLTQQMQRIECTPTAGELGALLLEARQIKELMPLFNQRLRRMRGLISLQPNERGCVHFATRIEPQPERPLFGLFRSRTQATQRLRALARERYLCLKVLGLEKGRGPCFARQLQQCRGACVGEESLTAHAARLVDALEPLQLLAWTWPGSIAIREEDAEHGLVEWHVIRFWCHLGSTSDVDALPRLAQSSADFDLDIYHLLVGWLRRHPHTEIIPL